jgi:hypothetical protein
MSLTLVCWSKEISEMVTGTDGGVRIAALEVKFLDRRKTN